MKLKNPFFAFVAVFHQQTAMQGNFLNCTYFTKPCGFVMTKLVNSRRTCVAGSIHFPLYAGLVGEKHQTRAGRSGKNPYLPTRSRELSGLPARGTPKK